MKSIRFALFAAASALDGAAAIAIAQTWPAKQPLKTDSNIESGD